MKILIIGAGGREHALAWKIEQNPRVEKIYIAPGNAGVKFLKKSEAVNLGTIEEIVDFSEKNSIDITLVGSEKFLVMGIVDRFREKNLKIFGPDKKAALLEGSKAYSKEFMTKYGIKTAEFQKFSNVDKALEYTDKIEYPVVVKASGLAEGKGVIIVQNKEECENAIKEIMIDKKFNEAGEEIVIEEFLEGYEASILSFTDSNVILPMLSAKDHKKIGVGETGLNTGGMGAISPNPHIDSETLEEFRINILEPTLNGIKQEGMDFEGVIFFGLMVTKKGVYLLEYNMRMGDPETQAILPLMKNDLIDIIEACINKNLKNLKLSWENKVTCCVVAASGGYPEVYKKGCKIDFSEDRDLIFLAGVVEDEKGNFLTSGGRVLNVVGIGKDLEEARENAYNKLKKIDFQGKYFRKDIGEPVS